MLGELNKSTLTTDGELVATSLNGVISQLSISFGAALASFLAEAAVGDDESSE